MSREVQFVVERQCPNTPNQQEPVPPPWPLAVWVFWPARAELTESGCRCYEVSPKGLRILLDAGIVFLDMPAFLPAVCEHMGRLIE